MNYILQKSNQVAKKPRSSGRMGIFFTILLFYLNSCNAEGNSKSTETNTSNSSSNLLSQNAISSNPAATNVTAGTGALGRMLGIKESSGVTLGGLWIANGNSVFQGGNDVDRNTANNLVVLDLNVDGSKTFGLPGSTFGSEFLQYNGANTNNGTGAVQGFNSISATAPFTRSELYQLWYLQRLFNKKLALRIGKSVASFDFNNVLRPTPLYNATYNIPSVSGLLYTPIFVNSSLLGVLPGYYNSAYGITANYTPNKSFYLSTGLYDGNQANGTQTGLTGPHFNGYNFYIAETGLNWVAGSYDKPGTIAMGYWRQTGALTTNTITQKDTQGVYAFGSQRLWYRNPGVDNSGINGFFQYGINNAQTLPMKQYFGFGFTGVALTLPKDTFGVGAAIAQLNSNLFTNNYEGMYQAYYQAYLVFSFFLSGAVTYIPKPGAIENTPSTWAGSLQLTGLF